MLHTLKPLYLLQNVGDLIILPLRAKEEIQVSYCLHLEDEPRGKSVGGI